MARIQDFTKLIFLILILLSSTFAQTKKLTGIEDIKKLKIGTTTVEETISEFGKPSQDSTDKLEYDLFPSRFLSWVVTGIELNPPESWFSEKRNEKIFRKLIFKGNKTIRKTELTFLENKLYLIDLTLSRKKSEKLLAADIEKIFNKDFVSVEAISKDAVVADYENQKETSPKAYYKFYRMLSVSPTNIYLAFVNNDSFKKEFWKAKGKPQKELFPGSVVRLQIFERNVR